MMPRTEVLLLQMIYQLAGMKALMKTPMNSCLVRLEIQECDYTTVQLP